MSEQHECSQSRLMSDGRLRAQGACPIPFPRGIARDTAFDVPPGDRQAPPAQRRTFTSLRSLETTQRGTEVKLGGSNQRLATEKGYEPVVVITEQEFRTLEERLHEAEQLYHLCAQEKTKLQGKLGRREETINYLHDEIERKDRSIEEYRNVLHQCKSEKKQLLRDLGKSEREVDDLQAQLGYVQKQLDKTDHLLNQRTDELKMADSYLEDEFALGHRVKGDGREAEPGDIPDILDNRRRPRFQCS
ncbi:hypothetical protein AX16_004885 [Volvariella volvacea WC 439]|nr:hypothetical protein AX16_004885 [Volvariella volvacea WC 439]